MEKSVSIVLSFIIMFSAFIGFENKAMADNTKKAAVQTEVTQKEILDFAKKQLGKPYQSGAKGPDAFDCSGFVYYVFKHFGYNMPSSSSEYWNNPSAIGTVIDESSTKKAKAGDIISWKNHVAIYTEKGGCIEALNYNYGVIDSFPVSAHSSGNGKEYRVIRVSGIVERKRAESFSESIRNSYSSTYLKSNVKNRAYSAASVDNDELTGGSSLSPQAETMRTIETESNPMTTTVASVNPIMTK